MSLRDSEYHSLQSSHSLITPLLGITGIAGVAALVGCSKQASAPPPLPLPPLPKTQAECFPFVLRQAQRQIEQVNEPALYFWRRLAWMQYHHGEPTLARRALDQATISLDTSSFGPNQESLERSALAEQYLAMHATDQARKVLGDFRYQGSSAQAQRLLSRTTLTSLETRRLQSPEIFLMPRLVVALLDKGPKSALQNALLPRLEFALMRGPEGGRAESYHGAIVLQFYLDDPGVAIRATEQQSATDKVRTLACLYWGGTTSPSAIFSQRESFPALQGALPVSVKRELRIRLLTALASLAPSKVSDQELTAIVMLAYQSGDSELLQKAADSLASSPYQHQVQQAIRAQQPILMPSIRGTTTSRHASINQLSRSLNRLAEMRPGPYQERLLAQFLSELSGAAGESIFTSALATLFRKHGQWDLLARLLTIENNSAFQCHQSLLQAEDALEKGMKQASLVALKKALGQLEQIEKSSHKAQEALFAQELARHLGNPEILVALEHVLVKLLQEVTIPLLKNDLRVRLTGLQALNGNHSAYQEGMIALQHEARQTGKEYTISGDLLERLAREQTRIGKITDAWESVGQIKSPQSRALALMAMAEQLRKTPPLPSCPLTTTLQNIGGRGLFSGPTR